ncbi:hypothetical protein H0H92_001838 [Tricholoma furcatifolium]|nr:hypothetical protein H0H92_001838 [Tricholoma furcatifolium]
MRVTALVAAASIAVSGVMASPLTVSLDATSIFGDLSSSNYYGAPTPPWEAGANPGWYFGSSPELYPTLTCLEGLICDILDLLPITWLHCPTPPSSTTTPTEDGYTQTFYNLTGATQASDYQTYGLVDTVEDCLAMCDSVSGCNFVNAYHDVNGKGGSTQLTCSLFTLCHTSSDADNFGGQTQPDGSVDYITDSEGWCKDGAAYATD